MTVAWALNDGGARVRGKRERAKAANRDAILAAARRVFAQLGYEVASVRDIIRGTKLAAGTFYNYFKSKEEVSEALQEEIVRRFRPVLRTHCDGADTFEDLVRGAFKAYFVFLAQEKDGAGLADGGERLASLRYDRPEMKAVLAEIHAEIERAAQLRPAPPMDAELFSAAALGVARGVSDRMLSCGSSPDSASSFCASFIIGGATGAPRQS